MALFKFKKAKVVKNNLTGRSLNSQTAWKKGQNEKFVRKIVKTWKSDVYCE